MSERYEISFPVKSFYASVTRRNVRFNLADEPIQIAGLSPVNSDKGERPCFTNHVYKEDKSSTLLDFPERFTQDFANNVFFLKFQPANAPEVLINSMGDYNGEPYAENFLFGEFEGFPNRTGVRWNWEVILDEFGPGTYRFFVSGTNTESEPFQLHDDNDLHIKNNSIVIKTISTGSYRNYRYFEGGAEPSKFDLDGWEDQIRILGQVLPRPAEKNLTITQYANYGQDIHQSEDQDIFDIIFKDTVPAYIVKRFEFYALNSDIYVTDNNKKSFDTYVNRRCVYNDSHNFDLTIGKPQLSKTTFSMKNYRAMGYDNRIKFE